MASLRPLTARAASLLLQEGKVTAADLLDASRGAAEHWWATGCIVRSEGGADGAAAADAAAARSDRRREEGGRERAGRSAVDGLPYVVKDNLLTEDFPTTACSRMLQ